MALRVIIFRAKDIPAADMNGKCDPFVEVNVNKTTKKTKKVKNTLTPSWSEEFAFKEGSFDIAKHSINLKIFDWDRFSKNDLLCTGVIHINPIAQYLGQLEQWVDMQPKKGHGNGGQLLVKVIYGDGTPLVKAPPEDDGERQRYEEAERLRQEAERQRLEAEEAERQRLEAEEAERQRREAEEAERKRLEAEEAERKRQEAEEAERKRKADTEEAERQRREAEEAERKRKGEADEADEAERQRREAEEAERKGKAVDDEAERKRKAEADEAERKRKADEEAASKKTKYRGPTHGLPPAEIQKAEDAFKKYDTDHSGTIDGEELKPLLRAVFGNKMKESLMDKFVAGQLASIDSNKTGQIEFPEFLGIWAKFKAMI